jgi:hypothetical protein
MIHRWNKLGFRSSSYGNDASIEARSLTLESGISNSRASNYDSRASTCGERLVLSEVEGSRTIRASPTLNDRRIK